MLSGLGKYAPKGDEIIPGISSLQLACARLRLDNENLVVISAHSRDSEHVKKQLFMELEAGKNVFLLPDSSFGAVEVADFLKSHHLSRWISVCERLGYPGERIDRGTTDKPPHPESDMYCVVITK